jgi:hypothetical protein
VPTFLELQDDAALLSFEHQLHLIDTVGDQAWDSDLAEPRFSFYGGERPTDGGTRIGFLLEHPDFVLPAPKGSRVLRVLEQGLADLRMYDHRRAFHAYAMHRGLGVEPKMRITGLGFNVIVEFNERNLMAAMSANLGSAT